MRASWIGALVAALLSWLSKSKLTGGSTAAPEQTRGDGGRVGSPPGRTAMAGSGDNPSWVSGRGENRGIEALIAKPDAGLSAILGAQSSSTLVSRRLVHAGRGPRWRAVSSTTRISCGSLDLR